MAAAGVSPMPWPFKSVFITGCNRGIGLEFVKQLLSLNDPPEKIFATCRSLEKASELKELAAIHSNLHLIELDLNNLEGINQAVSEVEGKLEGQGLNLLFNSAGVMDRSTLNEVTADRMMNVYKTNVVAPLMLTKAMLPLLRRVASQGVNRESTKPLIANMSSGVASITNNTWSTMYPYRPSKAALNMVTKSLSVDLADDGIMTVALHPGWVRTDMGGPNATLTVEQSVQGLITVIASLDDSKNGGFYDFSGKALPW